MFNFYFKKGALRFEEREGRDINDGTTIILGEIAQDESKESEA